MFTTTKNLKGLAVRATDGELGTLHDIYFDDQTWAIRYFVVETGSWMNERKVLISPRAILQADWQARRVDVSLSHKQVQSSPDIDTLKPVSRQHEAEYLQYYGYPYYWDGPPFESSGRQISPADSHLRSTEAVTGYHIDAKDGEIGHVYQFVLDDKAWTVRYLEIATQNWWPGKKVLLSPAWVERVSWAESKVYAAVTRLAIETCPEYLESTPITRDYESKIYFHYGQPPYWIQETKDLADFAMSGR